jgi:hypothetical protein
MGDKMFELRSVEVKGGILRMAANCVETANSSA